MSYFLFVDESGQDHQESPYEVLAGVVVSDRVLWPLICQLRDLEITAFGRLYADGARELKAKKLLKRKVYRQASAVAAADERLRTSMAGRALDDGASASSEEIAALAQAKLWFVAETLRACSRFSCAAFASIVPPGAPSTTRDHLRKDYAYLFERFFHFLDQCAPHEQGIVVFDELERSQSHLLVDQMSRYFIETQTGRTRSARVIPEPFFVHSELTTGVQLADLVAYIISWNVRVAGMENERRQELDELGSLVTALGPKIRPPGSRHAIRPFQVIDDLRPREERSAEKERQ